MPVTDGEIVVMSYAKYRELCRTIDTLTKKALKRPLFFE